MKQRFVRSESSFNDEIQMIFAHSILVRPVQKNPSLEL